MFTDRSRILSYQACPRLRLLNYSANGTGITKNKLAIPLATGTYIHMGLAALLQGASVDSASTLAVEAYWEAAHQALGAMKSPNDHYLYTIREQSALTEALVRVYALKGLPALLAAFEVIGVETEYEFPLVRGEERMTPSGLSREEGITFMARLDGELRHRDDGEIYVLSFKTDTGSNLDSKIEDARIDLQGLTEPIAYQKAHGIRPFGVKMEWLIKGSWKEEPRGSGRRYQDSYLVRPYIRDEKYAWQYFWACPGEPHQLEKQGGGSWTCKGTQATHGLGNTWDRVNIWERMPIKEWIDMLASDVVQSGVGDPLGEALYLPPSIVRTAAAQERALIQITRQERIVQNSLEVLSWGSQVLPEDVDELFPQHTATCNHSFGSECQFKEICFAADPEVALATSVENGSFIPRTPHHVGELEALKERTK